MVDQLPLKIPLDHDLNLDNFQRRRDLLQLLTGVDALLGGADQSLFLWGPTGTGKSHLLQGISRAIGTRALYLPMTELLQYAPEAVLEGVVTCEAVLVDDIQLIVGREDWQEALFHTFNRLKAAGIPQVYSGLAPPAQMTQVLPDLRSRWGELMVYHLPAFSESELSELLQFRASQRGLKISNEVVQYILHRAPRSTSALMALLDELDHAALARSRPITIPLLAELKLWSPDR
ncbi:MAG: DnaA regulatory inactivator Hda [Luminiphilus sp.]|nr:DnaA regulatory inactivator Hda [Luminiphilus sp.]